MPLDAGAFGFWLKAAFGAPSTTGTGPWTHEFQSGAWTLPSMSIETGMPEVPRYAMYSGCVLDQITWQMQRSGLLTATARLVAQGETVGTTTSAGTPAALELQRFGHFNGAITRNGSALGNVVSAGITYANNLDRIETIRSDGSDTSEPRRTLNPAFVEALMGWPTGWTAFGSAATAWSHWLPRMRCELSQLNCWPMDEAFG